MVKQTLIFEPDLFFCIWREEIESLYGWHHQRIYIDAWQRNLTSKEDFFNHYVYNPF